MENLILERSKEAFSRAMRIIPGGVDSPVRAFGAVGGHPPFIDKGRGSQIIDIDGNAYIDYVCSWGPLILGHADHYVIKNIKDALEKGTSFGAPTLLETRLVELIREKMPSMEKVRLVSSGTEATMSAIRLARAFTGKDIIVKFQGCYHGHVDSLLVSAGSGAMTFGSPTSPGIPQDFVKNTIVIPYNDIEAVKTCCKRYARKIACIIIEPVAGNMGVIPPKDGYLEEIREITLREKILLIFDEIITGFRVAHGGAQELYGITPDLTTLGKIIGGGMPVGAYGGRLEIMDLVSPLGPVYQAGTLSGNPIAMEAGIATLERLKEKIGTLERLKGKSIYEDLEEKSALLAEGLERSARDVGVPTFHTRVGSMLCTFFTDGEVVDYSTASKCDTNMYARYFHGMLERGFYFAPSQFEAAFVSHAHSKADIEATIKASCEVMKLIKLAEQRKASQIIDKKADLVEFINKLSSMCYKAEKIVRLTVDGFNKHNLKLINEAEALAKDIHYEEEDLANNLVNKAKFAISKEDKEYVNVLISVGQHIELIEDNLLNLLQYIRTKVNESILFSEKAVQESNELFSLTKDLLKSAGDALVTGNKALVKHILELETIASQKADDFETEHEERLIAGVCTPKASSLYLNILNSIKEVNWHIRQFLERIFSSKNI